MTRLRAWLKRLWWGMTDDSYVTIMCYSTFPASPHWPVENDDGTHRCGRCGVPLSWFDHPKS